LSNKAEVNLLNFANITTDDDTLLVENSVSCFKVYFVINNRPSEENVFLSNIEVYDR